MNAPTGNVFLAGMAVFALGSMACALSPDAAVLIVSRAVQGVGGAAMLALTLSIITETFPPGIRAGAIGTWAAVGGTGFGVGPVAGGVLLTFFGWASVFWVNVPFAVIGIAATAVAVRESRNPRSRRLDRPGAVMSAAGLVAVTLGLIESASHPWTSWPVAAPLLIGALMLAGFGLWERRTPHAMVPPGLLRARSFVSSSARRPLPGVDPGPGGRAGPERRRGAHHGRRQIPRRGLPPSRRRVVRARIPPGRRDRRGLPGGRRARRRHRPAAPPR
jgi:MFS family permease